MIQPKSEIKRELLEKTLLKTGNIDMKNLAYPVGIFFYLTGNA